MRRGSVLMGFLRGYVDRFLCADTWIVFFEGWGFVERDSWIGISRGDSVLGNRCRGGRGRRWIWMRARGCLFSGRMDPGPAFLIRRMASGW
jgi:hypothetical protein